MFTAQFSLGFFSKNCVPAYQGGVSGDNTLSGAFYGLDNNFSGVEQVLSGNRIISMSCLTTAINSVYHSHNENHCECKGNFILFPALSSVCQQGLGSALTFRCTLCSFENTLCMKHWLMRVRVDLQLR